jgi:hypothetical protein
LDGFRLMFDVPTRVLETIFKLQQAILRDKVAALAGRANGGGKSGREEGPFVPASRPERDRL